MGLISTFLDSELTVIRRPGYDERVDVDPVSESPLVLRVVSESVFLAERTAQHLAEQTGGSVTREWSGV